MEVNNQQSDYDDDDDDAPAPELEQYDLSDDKEEDEDEDEDDDGPRRSGRPRRGVTRLEPQMRGQQHQDIQAMQAAIEEKIGDDSIVLKEGEEQIFAIIMMQVSLKQGIKLWGDRAKESAIGEMTQLHNISAFFPRDPKSLTREERIKALYSLIFLKEKRCGKIKSRQCINGAPQRNYIPKEEATSPTVNNPFSVPFLGWTTGKEAGQR